MAEYPIIMKQKNDQGDYDTLYPKTLGSQVEGNIQSSQIEGDIPSSQITGQFPASQINDIFTKSQILTQATAALFGLGTDSVPNDVLSWIGKYAQYWWKRRVIDTIQKAQFDQTVDSASNNTTYYIVKNNGGDATVNISDNVIVDSSGNIKLENPVAKKFSITSSDRDVLKGKYVETVNTIDAEYKSKIYYVPQNTEYMDTQFYGDYYVLYSSTIVTLKVVSVSAPGEWKYVQSSNRSAYPDSGEQDGYEYQYLGVPFENAVGASKIETGSYVGTGTYGSSNPNSLTFGFEPKVVFIHANGSSSYCQFYCFALTDVYSSFGYMGSVDGTMQTTDQYRAKVSNNLLNWYYDGGASQALRQFNSTGFTYTYIAIG